VRVTAPTRTVPRRKRPHGFVAKLPRDPIVLARLTFALGVLAEGGQLVGARTKRMSARVDPGLLKAVKAKTGLKNDSVSSALPLRLSRPRTISVRGLPRRRVGYRGISSLIFDFDTILNRCAPEKWTRSLAYRPSKDLPFNPAAVPQGAPILLDTTVYIDQLKGDLPPPIIDLIATRPVHHGAHLFLLCETSC
jgi:hypothetical protein